MSEHDFIPKTDHEFHVFQDQYVTEAIANPDAYGLSAADVAGLTASRAAYAASVTTHENAHKAAHVATEAKHKAQLEHTARIRAATHKLNGVNGVTNEMRAKLALPPHVGHGSLPAPTEAPLVRAEAHGHTTVVLHVHDAATPNRAHKPHGVHGAQIYCHVGAPAPSDPSGYAHIATSTRSRFVDVHAPADAGKDVFYLLRWEDGKGQTGPWSDVIATKIPL